MSGIQFALVAAARLLYSFVLCCSPTSPPLQFRCGWVADIDAGYNTYLDKYTCMGYLPTYLCISAIEPSLLSPAERYNAFHRFEQRNRQTCPYDSKCCHDYLLIQNRQHRGLCWIRGQSTIDIPSPLAPLVPKSPLFVVFVLVKSTWLCFYTTRIDELSRRSLFNYL